MISEVYNEDCMVGMAKFPDKFFDLAIVDPPYGLGNVNFCTKPKQIHQEKKWNSQIPNYKYFDELHRISKNRIIWGCNYYFPYIRDNGRIVWDKLIPKHGLQTFSDCDLASNSLENRIIKFTYEWRGNVQNGKIDWKNIGIDARIHPTQKPIALYKWLLKNYAKEGNKIIDTHLGSQSSRIACYDGGFDFWGWEIDKDYFDEGCKRFENYKAQLKLF